MILPIPAEWAEFGGAGMMLLVVELVLCVSFISTRDEVERETATSLSSELFIEKLDDSLLLLITLC